jgi:Flp pilus assembly protein TadG
VEQLVSPAKRRGHALVEFALLSPWIFFVFVGVLDLGFYCYAFMCAESAARVAATYTSTNIDTAADSAGACTRALGLLAKLPNVGTGVTTCAANPVVVTASAATGSDGSAASQVSVRYQTVALIPIPGLLAKQLTITRAVTMRLRS